LLDGQHGSYYQTRVSGTCAAGSSISAIAADGTVTCEADNDTTDHGSLGGLGDDDHTQYFYLSQNETVSGIPAFNGGTSGTTAPFTVDSTFLVANLNSDLLDGQHGSYYQTRVSGTCAAANQAIKTIAADGTVTCETLSDITDHGGLAGLGDNDHPQYVIKAGDTMGGRLGQSASGFHVATKDDITTRTDSGFYETSTATTAEGWPVSSGGWYHLLTSTHSNDGNYYSMQFAADFFSSGNLFYRSTNGVGTTAWNRIWHSGNDGTGSGMDADTVDGKHFSDAQCNFKAAASALDTTAQDTTCDAGYCVMAAVNTVAAGNYETYASAKYDANSLYASSGVAQYTALSILCCPCQ